MSSSSSKPKYPFRQSPKAFRKPLQWQVDSDYLDKLSPADREWMLRFQEAEYGGNGHLMHDDQDEQRRLWVQQKKQQRDAMTYARLEELPIAQGSQPSPEDAFIEALDREAETKKRVREEARKAGVTVRTKKRRMKERRAAQAKRRKKQAKLAALSGQPNKTDGDKDAE